MSNDSYSQDKGYSMNNSMVGVYKEENEKDSESENDNKSNLLGLTGKNNEDDEELSDIEKKPINNEYDFDDDFDLDEDIDMITDFTRTMNNSEFNESHNNNEENDEDKNVIRKRKTDEEISKCFKNIYEDEPDLIVDFSEGFTQMVNKNIIKKENLPYYTNNEMLEILMIAEKPSLATTITKILSRGIYRKHYHDPITIYTYEGYFKGKKAFFTISSVRGHIYQDSFQNKDDDSDENNVNKLYKEEVVKTLKIKENDEKKFFNIPQFLRNIAEGKDILCLWLDCDPEGENICFEVIHNVYPYLNKRKYQQIYRAKFNSLTVKDIRQSFENLDQYPNKKLSMSVDARSVIDFKVGVCFSRLFSEEILRYIKKNNKKRIMSYGPCQTPTLWFCVQRAKEKKKYKSTSYYKIYIEIEDEKKNVYKLYMNKKLKSKNDLIKRLNKVKCYFFTELVNKKYKKKRQSPPFGLKTTTMLKMASLQLGLSPYEASRDAQKLYMYGLISYPRTKSTKYSENYDFENSLKMFKNNNHFSEKVNNLLNIFDKRNINFSRGEEKGGHQPIVPTLSKTRSTVEDRLGLNWDLYRCICLYYFASLSPQLEYENMEYTFILGKYKLRRTFSKLINKGFLEFLPLKNKSFEDNFPSFELNKHYKIINIDYEKHHDHKLDCLTEAELIDQMENKNIGTDGSIPSHISNLTRRGYVKVNEHRRIIPTKLGVALIDSLNEVVPDIVKPKNRAKIEEFVKQIETGEKKYKEVIEEALKFYQEKLKYCSNNIEELRYQFGNYFKIIILLK